MTGYALSIYERKYRVRGNKVEAFSCVVA